ncbi:MAG: DUF1501 domain-containing protein [Planctomycetota bacterium]
MVESCRVDSKIQRAGDIDCTPPDAGFSRRNFLRNVAATTAGLSCLDFLSYFAEFGLPFDRKAFAFADGAASAHRNPHFLVYWFIEGGWMGYDMFNPVSTDNNVLKRLKSPSDEFYRVLKFGQPDYGIYKHGNIRHGYLASPGRELFSDLAVLSSMHTGTGHSTERLRAHMGSYKFRAQQEREEDERSVMQAFAEVYGQPYALPNLSWHWWLSDGELNIAQYTGRKGYYHALGPAHAHTIYPGTPARLRSFFSRMMATSGDAVNREVQRFLEAPHRAFLRDENIEAVKSYRSAREIYLSLAAKGLKLDQNVIRRLFVDPALREEFQVSQDDELLTYRSVNGNKARSKFAPSTNVQAMMAYELMRAGLSCSFWIESRDVRRFDSHMSRARLWTGKEQRPVGQKDQSEMLEQDLWSPLKTFVRKLKETEYEGTGSSLFDHTTIVLNSEFGRSMHGNVDSILRSKDSEANKKKKIGGQDISQHWRVTSAAFLGGKVAGGKQYGGAGEKTLEAIPLLPNGEMDPAYDKLTGERIEGRQPDPRASIPNHGDVYATALYLSDINPRGRGRNERGPLRYIRAHKTRTF